MADIIELSDDNDSNKNNSDTDTSIDTDIANILNKYKNINNAKPSQETISPSSSDSDLDDISELKSLREKLQEKYNLNSKNVNILLDDKPKKDCATSSQEIISSSSSNSDLDGISELKSLREKYNLTSNSKNVKILLDDDKPKKDCATSSQETISCSSSDSDLDDISELKSLREKLQEKYNLISNSKNVKIQLDNKPEKDIVSQSSSQDTIESEENDYIKSPKPKRQRSTNKEDKKLEKEQERARKQAEKEQMKAEAAKAKANKKEIALAYKNLKPDECIKFIFVSIDSDLISMECGADIPSVLQAANINYKVNSHIHPLTITWKRNNQAQLTTVDGELKLLKNDDPCEEVLLIILWNEFINLVHQNNLCSYFKNIQSIMPEKKIFLGIYDIDNYFKFQKSQKQKLTSKEKNYATSPKVSRRDIDMSLIELQLLFNVSHRFVETPQDLSAMVLQFTKSIAQIPYKLQKEMKQQQMDWYVSGDNRDCVRVDKNGYGLQRLWQQQITQFNLARLEIAQAITSKYNSPSSLMKEYEECNSVEEGEKLLQDIPIRRAAGPLTSVRKIGPEFSKKMYSLFTSLDGDILL